MDTPTSAAPDEKTPPLELALATQLSKSATQETSKPSGPLEISAERINSSVARLTSNSIDELQGVSFRTPKNARIPEVRGRQRAAPNRQRVGRN
jgi:hypothetical protein